MKPEAPARHDAIHCSTTTSTDHQAEPKWLHRQSRATDCKTATTKDHQAEPTWLNSSVLYGNTATTKDHRAEPKWLNKAAPYTATLQPRRTTGPSPNG